MIGFDVTGKKGLAIAEKPSLARTIEAVYLKNKNVIPYDLTFIVQRGHLLGLKNPDEANEEYKEWNWENLPITEKTLGGWPYEVKQEKRVGHFKTSQERFEDIKNEINSGDYDFIVHIGDPDREGQLLVDLVLEKIGTNLPVMRYWQNALTDEKVLKTLLNLRSNDEDFFQNILSAGKGRQHADYIVGMNLSRAATMKMGSRVSVGRVRTVVLSLVCRRELEILNFKPETMYGVQAKYVEGFNGTLFNSSEAKDSVSESDESDEADDSVQTGTIWFKTEEEAKKFINDTSRKGIITHQQSKRTESYSPSFYKLSTIQKEAGDKYGYNAEKTKDIIQSLYEAKLTTYPRTNCEYIDSTETLDVYLKSVSDVPNFRLFLEKITPTDIERVRNTKKWVNDAKVKDSGHTAIIPTSEKVDFSKLSVEQKNIYEMIAKRYVAAFLPPLVQNKVDMVVTIDDSKTFVSRGKTLVSLGWAEFYDRSVNDVVLPNLNKGDSVSVEDFIIPQKTTQCPKRYTSSDLIAVGDNPTKYLEDKTIKKSLKKLQIGTPATLSEIINQVVSRDKYATWAKEGKREVMKPNKVGLAIYNNFKNINFSLLEVDTTGTWEIMLKDITEGVMQLSDFENQVYQFVSSMILEIKNSNMSTVVQDNGRVEIGECKKCGGKIIQTEKAFFCSNYKNNGCMSGGYRNQVGHLITAEEFNQLQSGEEIVVDAIFEEKDEKGKVISKRKYKQRLGVDEKGTITRIKSENKDSSYICPACGKRILENDNAYACEGRIDKSCNVYLGKVTSGVQLKQEDIDLILSGKDSGVIKNLKPITKPNEKKKSPYDAILFIDKEKKCLSRKFPSNETKFVCPVCGKPLREAKGRLFCSGVEDHSCKFQMFSVMYKKPIPEKKLQKMLEQARSGAISGGEEAFVTTEIVDTNLQCPYCATLMKRSGMQFGCPNCKFNFYRTIVDELLTDEDVEMLLSTGKTDVKEGLISPNGPCAARKVLNYDAKTVDTEYIQMETKSEYVCPICGKENLVLQGIKYSCKNCNFVAWTVQGGKKLTSKEEKDLFTKHATGVRKMKSKENRLFEAKVVIDFEKKGTKFMFPNNKKQKG